jgi:hypothetical protein
MNPIFFQKKLLRLIANYLYLARFDLIAPNRIFTHLTLDEKVTLHRIISRRANQVNTCIEIGSFLGSSACFIASALKIGSKLHCIDTWKNDAMKYSDGDKDVDPRDTYEEFKSNTRNYSKSIVASRIWSTDFDTSIISKMGIDFMFIDGDHSYDGVNGDWDHFSPFMNKNSLVAFHDTGWADGVNRVIAEKVLPFRFNKIVELPNLQIFEKQ